MSLLLRAGTHSSTTAPLHSHIQWKPGWGRISENLETEPSGTSRSIKCCWRLLAKTKLTFSLCLKTWLYHMACSSKKHREWLSCSYSQEQQDCLVGDRQCTARILIAHFIKTKINPIFFWIHSRTSICVVCFCPFHSQEDQLSAHIWNTV